MRKTDIIKDRRVDVYVDTIDRQKRWTQYAEEADESLSQFVQQCVEYAIEQGEPLTASSNGNGYSGSRYRVLQRDLAEVLVRPGAGERVGGLYPKKGPETHLQQSHQLYQ